MALRRLYNICALIGLCVHIRILRFKQLMRTDKSFAYLQRLGYSFLRFADSFNVCATVMIGRLEDPSEGCDLQGSFADNMNVLIGPSCGSVFWVLPRSYFGVPYVIQLLTLTSDHLFDEQYYNPV